MSETKCEHEWKDCDMIYQKTCSKCGLSRMAAELNAANAELSTLRAQLADARRERDELESQLNEARVRALAADKNADHWLANHDNQKRMKQDVSEKLSQAIRALSTAQAENAKMREAWQEFLSAQKTIDEAGFMDNYTDSARARAQQQKVVELVRTLLSPAPVTQNEGEKR